MDPVSLMEADVISNTIRDFIRGFFIHPPTSARCRQVRCDAAALAGATRQRRNTTEKKGQNNTIFVRRRYGATLSFPFKFQSIPVSSQHSQSESLHLRRSPSPPSPRVKRYETQKRSAEAAPGGEVGEGGGGCNPPGKTHTAALVSSHDTREHYNLHV